MRYLAAFAVTLLAGTALAQPQALEEILFSATTVNYNEQTAIVEAQGNVEIVVGERIVRADSIIYNRTTGQVLAQGNIALLQPDGTVLFSDSMELSDDLRNGVINQLRLRLPDDARLAAVAGTRQDGTVNTLYRAVFSPCAPCADDPAAAPLWQVKADRVTYDEAAKKFEYRNARMEFYGIPVLYTPYFSHASPDAPNESGFLMAGLGRDSTRGMIVSTPYYWSLSPSRDITITPTFMSDAGTILGGEYREFFSNGKVDISGSIARVEKRVDGRTLSSEQTAGHIFAKGEFDLNDQWRVGADIARSSNESYLKRFDISSDDILRSHVYAERFNNRTYTAVNTYAFQDLRPGRDSDTSPLIHPLIEHDYTSQPDAYGAYTRVQSSLLSLTRTDGSDSQRLSVKGGWHVPHISASGLVTHFSATVQADGYAVNDQPNPNGADSRNGLAGRVFPQVAYQMRYPLQNTVGDTRVVVEPIIGFVAAPNGNNSALIPNEDSQTFEFDDTNLFTPSRFVGLDRVGGGQRVDYAVAATWLGPRGTIASSLIGQSYRLQKDRTYLNGSGLEDNLSDIVGRIDLNPAPWLDALFRFRLDNNELTFRRGELGFGIGPERYRLNLDYIFLDAEAGGGQFNDREQVSGNLTIALTDYWTWRGYGVRSLEPDSATRNAGTGLTYEDECFMFALDYERDFTTDPNRESSNTLFARVGFRYLGDSGFRNNVRQSHEKSLSSPNRY